MNSTSRLSLYEELCAYQDAIRNYILKYMELGGEKQVAIDTLKSIVEYYAKEEI